MKFKCEFCSRQFNLERTFTDHMCADLKKHAITQTPRGRAAFYYYNQWKSMMGYPKSTIETFSISKYFNVFNKFIDFTNSKMVPDRLDYMKFVVSKKLLPNLWYDQDVYSLYIKEFDQKQPIELIEITLMNIESICRIVNCSPPDIFQYMSPHELIKMIVARRFSPWILLNSKKFIDFCLYKTTQEEKIIFHKLLTPAKWKEIFINNPEILTIVKNIVLDLQL